MLKERMGREKGKWIFVEDMGENYFQVLKIGSLHHVKSSAFAAV